MTFRWAFIAFLVFASLSRSQTTATIRTSQTVLELQPAADSPRMVSLGGEVETPLRNSVAEPLVSSVELGGKTVPARWHYDPAASQVTNRHVMFVYECASPKLRAEWEWKAPDTDGPIEHTVRIRNLDSREMWIPLQDSFRFQWKQPATAQIKQFFVEKGAGSPSAVGTHELPVPVAYQWSGTSSTYAHPAAGQPREIIPFFAVKTVGRTESGWYVGLEFSGRTRLSLSRTSNAVTASAGLDEKPGPFRTRLQPGGVFETPTAFVGAFRGNLDDMSNVLRAWVRHALTNPRTWKNPNYPLLVNNSWGSGMQVDEALAQRMIRDSAELGLEMFHIDAGWFRGVGDWYPNPKKFPHGLVPVADRAHKLGLKFGIWVDWTQAALDQNPGALNVHDPKVRNWLVSDLPRDWRPEEFKGQTIDIGDPAAKAYAQKEVHRLVNDYRLDMLEHDGYLVAQGCVRNNHPHAPPDPKHLSIVKNSGAYFVESANSTDVSYHAVRAYYDIHNSLRRQHPDLLLEVCNDGGRMVDFGTAAHADYFSITDTYDPLSNRRAFYDTSYVLPPAMLESYVEKWPTPKIENFRYMLRSGMMGWLTLMLDTTAWNESQHAAAKQEISLYKSNLRKLIRDAQLYHVSNRPDGVHWDGIEYFDPQQQRGVVFAFHGSDPKESEHTYKLKGLVRDKQYRVRFHDGSSPERKMSGKELIERGLIVKLPVPLSSELIFLTSAT